MYKQPIDEIHLILGNDCNFHCDFCFWERRAPTPKWGSIKHVVDKIIETGIKKITVGGGRTNHFPFFSENFKILPQKQPRSGGPF